MAKVIRTRPTGLIQQVPVNKTVPVVTGTTTVGQVLSSTAGTWEAHPEPSFSYQWFWHDTSAAISGATNSSYTLVGGDATHTIRCRVTATNRIGSTAANSIPTAAVTA